jgi:alcohol dehydrogenase
MSRTCTAAVFDGTGTGFSFNTFQLEPIAEGDVLVEVAACALCGSDLHTIAGRRTCSGPTVLGHEIVGRVIENGGAVADWSGQALEPGDRVTWTIAASCGSCFYCQKSLPQKCEHLVKYGHADSDSRGPLGGLATHCRLLPGTAIFQVPDTLDDLQAAPANCCTATSVAAVRQAGDIHGATLLVMGAGSLGVTVAEYALHRGAASVVLADIDASRLKTASALPGCTPLHIDASGLEMPESIRQLTDGRGVDIAVDVSGATSAIESALAWLRVGGRIVLVGSVFSSPPIALDPETVVRRMLSISGLHNYRPDDLAEALAFLAELPADAPSRSLAGRSYPLSEIDQAVAAADSNEHLRVVITPNA